MFCSALAYGFTGSKVRVCCLHFLSASADSFKALNRAAQIAKAVGALGAFAFLQIFLSVLQTLQLVLFLCKLRLGSLLFGSELFKGFRFCYWD